MQDLQQSSDDIGQNRYQSQHGVVQDEQPSTLLAPLTSNSTHHLAQSTAANTSGAKVVIEQGAQNKVIPSKKSLYVRTSWMDEMDNEGTGIGSK